MMQLGNKFTYNFYNESTAGADASVEALKLYTT